MGLVVAFGLALFLLTRGESGDALEADTYERAMPDVEAPAAVIADGHHGAGEPPA
jgi:hypothetical protein